MKESSGKISLAIALAASMSQCISINHAQDWEHGYKNSRRRGHWMASSSCKAPSIARSKAKRAKQARKLHRKAK